MLSNAGISLGYCGRTAIAGAVNHDLVENYFHWRIQLNFRRLQRRSCRLKPCGSTGISGPRLKLGQAGRNRSVRRIDYRTWRFRGPDYLRAREVSEFCGLEIYNSDNLNSLLLVWPGHIRWYVLEREINNDTELNDDLKGILHIAALRKIFFLFLRWFKMSC